MACNQFVTLNNGLKMPSLGLGTWQSSPDETKKVIKLALDLGYRHLDTAPVYLNEAAIGQALKEYIDSGKLSRDQLFIVTKLPPTANRPGDVEATLRRSLADLQLDFVDLYLIHTPFALYPGPDGFKRDENGVIVHDTSIKHAEVWKIMEQMMEKGLTKSIGISNFNKEQIERLLESCTVKPSNLQIEHHVYLQQPELLKFCKAQNISVTAYAPLGSKGVAQLNKMSGINRDLPDLLDVPEVKHIASTHGKTPAQVLLRWILDCGLIAIPKSSNENRLKENIDIFDFHLSDSEIEKLRALDANLRIVDFAFFPGVEKHPEFPF